MITISLNGWFDLVAFVFLVGWFVWQMVQRHRFEAKASRLEGELDDLRFAQRMRDRGVDW